MRWASEPRTWWSVTFPLQDKRTSICMDVSMESTVVTEISLHELEDAPGVIEPSIQGNFYNMMMLVGTQSISSPTTPRLQRTTRTPC